MVFVFDMIFIYFFISNMLGGMKGWCTPAHTILLKIFLHIMNPFPKFTPQGVINSDTLIYRYGVLGIWKHKVIKYSSDSV